MTVRRFDHEGRLIDEEQEDSQFQATEPKEESLEHLLARTEAKMRGHFPMMVDSATRLDAVKAGPSTLHYHYTLLNAGAEDLDVEATRAALTPVVQQQAQGMEFLKLLMQKGATISFHYHDKDGKEITVIEVSGDTQV